MLQSFFNTVARDRRWWQALFWINFFGSAYGFWWYRAQLQATPVRYWLFVPDSPGSTLMFTAFLAALLAGAGPGATGGRAGCTPIRGWLGVLGAFAFVSNMKYGLWTAIVLPQAGIVTGNWTFDHIHLSLSHAGMWVQGMLYARCFRPGLPAALAAWAWMYVQDYVDYWLLMTHPTLPEPALVGSVRWIAVALSTAWGGFVAVQAWRDGHSGMGARGPAPRQTTGG